MDVASNFTACLQSNKTKQTDLNYGVPLLDEDNLHYYVTNINSICDQIHSLIRNSVKKPCNEEIKWKFMEFLSTRGAREDMTYFMRVLKEVQANFSNIIDAEVLFNSETNEPMSPSHTLLDIVNTM